MRIKTILITFFILLIFLLNVSAKNIKNEKPDFKLLIEKTDSLIKIKSLRGCSFKRLSFTLFQGEIKNIDKNGMVSLLEKGYKNPEDENFLFTIKNAGNKLVFNGLQGTRWKKADISLEANDFRFYLDDKGVESYVFKPKQVIYKTYSGGVFFEGEYEIIIFDENKSIALNKSQEIPQPKIGNRKLNFLNCFDKEKKSVKERIYDVDSASGELELIEIFTPKWESLNMRDRKARYKRTVKVIPAYIDIPDELSIDIVYPGEKKEIKSYECHKAEVIKNGNKYHVWFTTEMELNWSFNNFIYDIPGAVIRIETDEKKVLELDKVKGLNKADSLFSETDMELIKEEW